MVAGWGVTSADGLVPARSWEELSRFEHSSGTQLLDLDGKGSLIGMARGIGGG